VQPTYPQPPRQSSSTTVIIVLACVFGGLVVIGILAAIAIPSFLKMQKKTKRSEAELNLRSIEKGIKAYYAESSSLPQPSAFPTPDVSCCDMGRSDRKCEPEIEAWMAEPWSTIGFEVYEPGYFQYSYEVAPDGKTFTAHAIGDLDCDGTTAAWTLAGEILPDGNLETQMIKPTTAD
jgi:type II secretory pathway pseudopilin PulG